MTVSADHAYSLDEQRQAAAAEQISVTVAGAILAAVGWAGLLWLLTNRLPTVPNRWAFYALLHIALTGTALPIVRLLHRRFSREGGMYVPTGVMIRQASWLGVYAALCAWLRIPRLLSAPVALIIAAALITIEVLLRVRERTQWRPD